MEIKSIWPKKLDSVQNSGLCGELFGWENWSGCKLRQGWDLPAREDAEILKYRLWMAVEMSLKKRLKFRAREKCSPWNIYGTEL
jgi:hypothetical protein